MIAMQTIFALGSLGVTFVTSLPAQQPATSAELAHTRTEFNFTVNASFEQTAPLFGANEERKWSPDWSPHFVYPLPARDQPGMVFQVAHGQYSSVWINTAFDLAGGRIQYAYVVNDAMTTVIDIHLTSEGAQKTGVTVVYEPTALMLEANQHVQHFAKSDEEAAKEWEEAIDGYLAKLRGTDGPRDDN